MSLVDRVNSIQLSAMRSCVPVFKEYIDQKHACYESTGSRIKNRVSFLPLSAPLLMAILRNRLSVALKSRTKSIGRPGISLLTNIHHTLVDPGKASVAFALTNVSLGRHLVSRKFDFGLYEPIPQYKSDHNNKPPSKPPRDSIQLLMMETGKGKLE